MAKKSENKKTPVKRVKKVADTKAKAVKKSAASVQTSEKYTSMFAAWRAYWRRGFTDWRGTTSRSGYWFPWLMNLLIILVLFGLYMWIGGSIVRGDMGMHLFPLFFIATWGLILYIFAIIVPSLSNTVRRLRDGGFSVWWVLLYLAGFLPMGSWLVNIVTFVLSIILLVLLVMPTKVDGNPHHKNNKK